MKFHSSPFDWTYVFYKHNFCVRGTRTHSLIFVGCSVHYWLPCAINKGLHLCRHTFASLWRANSSGDSLVLGVHFSNVFWDLLLFVFVKRAYFKSFLKVYYRSVFIESSKVVFWKWVRLLTHASMKPGCLARRLLCHKVNLPRCEARRRHFIMTCDIFGTGQTNILALCYLLGKTYKPAHSSATRKSLKSTHSTKLLERLLTQAHTHST